MPEIIIALVIGIVGGWLSGMLGIGGGAIFVPAMVLLLDRSQHMAQGTSLAVIIATAIAGSIVHWRHGNIDMGVARLVTPGAMIFGFLGGALAIQLPAEALRRIFALVLIFLALRMLAGTGWPRKASPAAQAGGGR